MSRCEDVEHLREGSHQRQADAERIELAERLGAGHDERHSAQRYRQRRPVQPAEALAEPEGGGDGDACGVQVEHEQRERDRDPFEGHEGREVEHHVGEGRGQHEPAVAGREGSQRDGADTGRQQPHADEGADHQRTDCRSPGDQRQRVDARIAREPAQGAERAEAGRRERDEPRPGEIGTGTRGTRGHRVPTADGSASASASSCRSLSRRLIRSGTRSRSWLCRSTRPRTSVASA